MGTSRRWLAVAVAGSLVVVMAGPAMANAGSPVVAGTDRVSLASDGAQANDGSFSSALSADGRYVAFGSDASNLVPGDTNGERDVFVRDRLTGTTSRVNVASDGAQANWETIDSGIAISADGRFVTFMSSASNLVPGDTNGDWDAFVRDRLTGTTSLISVSSTGVQGNAFPLDSMGISADGRFVVFVSDSPNLMPGETSPDLDVFVRDRWTGTTSRVSLADDGTGGNGASLFPAISADGRFVAFVSFASNLVPGDTNGDYDVFVRDRQAGTTSRASVASDGTQANGETSFRLAISADGRYVAFSSFASNLVPGDTNGVEDVFLRDRWAGSTRRVSVSSEGGQGNADSVTPALSADGSDVSFESLASNLVPGDTNGRFDVFVGH